MIWKEHSQVVDSVGFPPDFPVFPFSSATCSNGDVNLVYGAPEYVGLGSSVLVMLVFVELFGSVFMKNCNVFIALMFGYMVAALSSHEGNAYVLADKIQEAEAITFLWVETFPLGKWTSMKLYWWCENKNLHHVICCYYFFRFLCSCLLSYADWILGDYHRDSGRSSGHVRRFRVARYGRGFQRDASRRPSF